MAKDAFEGLEKLKQAIKKSGPAIIQRMILEIEKSAKELVPVDTGRLKSSITSKMERGAVNEPIGKVGTNVKYAPYVEFGTKKQVAQPYLYPALRHNLIKLRNMTEEEIKRFANG